MDQPHENPPGTGDDGSPVAVSTPASTTALPLPTESSEAPPHDHVPHPHRRASLWLRLTLAERRRRRDRNATRLLWRLVTPAVFAAAGILMVISAVNSEGTDLRPGRYDDLADLAATETRRVQGLRDEIQALNDQIDTLTAGIDNTQLDKLNGQIATLEQGAHISPLQGPGLTVTLDDAPRAVLDSAGDKVADALVHQQDIQAVVNAMWAGGAEAITIQGQRVIATTGIKCIGNTVRLNGLPYSPPYVISGIGNPERLRRSIDTNRYIDSYLQDVADYQLGFAEKVETRIVAPEYDGPLDLRYARAVDGLVDDGT